MGMVAGAYQSGSLKRGYENNVLSGAAPFYRTYECADGRHIAIGSLEPQFYARFIEAMDMQHYADREQRDPAHWPTMSAELEDKFRTRPLADWLALLEPLGIQQLVLVLAQQRQCQEPVPS